MRPHPSRLSQTRVEAAAAEAEAVAEAPAALEREAVVAVAPAVAVAVWARTTPAVVWRAVAGHKWERAPRG